MSEAAADRDDHRGPEAYSVLDLLPDGGNDETARQLAQLLAGYLQTPIAVAIINLGITEVLEGTSLTAGEIAEGTESAPDATARLLRAGMAVGLVAGESGGRFTLTELGRRLGPAYGSIGEIAGMWLPPIREALGGLDEHVRSGRQVDPSAPGGFWEYLGTHPQEAVRFSRAMGAATSRLLVSLSGSGYRPPSSKRVIDVGGNRGTVLAWLLRELPEADGVVFDRPEALRTTAEYLAAMGVADRTEPVGGSFFTEVPEGDLHVLSRVLHNWDDDRARVIIGNCAKAARPGGSLVLIEYVLPSEPVPTVGHLMDVLMMVLYGGRERTVEEHRALVEPAGYTFTRDVPVGAVGGRAAPVRILEFRKE